MMGATVTAHTRAIWCSLVRRLVSLRPQKAPPRLCEWCGIQLPEDTQPGDRYCKRTHARKARRHRNGRPVRDARVAADRAREAQARLDAAWTLRSSPGTHAVSCARKYAYSDFGEALTALRWLRETSAREDEQRRVYKCLVCSQWHITSQVPRAVQEA